MAQQDIFLDPGDFIEAANAFGFTQRFSEISFGLSGAIENQKDAFDLDDFIAELWFDANPDSDEVMLPETLRGMFDVIYADVVSAIENGSSVSEQIFAAAKTG